MQGHVGDDDQMLLLLTIKVDLTFLLHEDLFPCFYTLFSAIGAGNFCTLLEGHDPSKRHCDQPSILASGKLSTYGLLASIGQTRILYRSSAFASCCS